ncbi:hypothetical protein GCM10022224_072000 [Nonomuraea antimicrobica]|uniref:Mce-associated membrane protein n=1 Tax=Nonomuraea antimicrobica TaxID=561173 RepID=A0ABP7CT42_9ACTN
MTTGHDLPDTESTSQPAADTGTAAEEATATTTGEKATGEKAGDETAGGPTAGGEAADGETADGETAGDGSEAGRARSRLTRVRLLGALAAMLVAAIAATAVLQWISAAQAQDARSRLESERALRLEVSGAASAFSRALLSYDYQGLQNTRSTLAAQATGDFLSTYDAAFGGAMAQVIVKLKATSQATVREVYLADVDEATAHAIVVVDQQVNTSEAIRSVKDSHLKISLVKEKGSWKINDVTVLGAASEDQYNLDGDDAKTKE